MWWQLWQQHYYACCATCVLFSLNRLCPFALCVFWLPICLTSSLSLVSMCLFIRVHVCVCVCAYMFYRHGFSLCTYLYFEIEKYSLQPHYVLSWTCKTENHSNENSNRTTTKTNTISLIFCLHHSRFISLSISVSLFFDSHSVSIVTKNFDAMTICELYFIFFYFSAVAAAIAAVYWFWLNERELCLLSVCVMNVYCILYDEEQKKFSPWMLLCAFAKTNKFFQAIKCIYMKHDDCILFVSYFLSLSLCLCFIIIELVAWIRLCHDLFLCPSMW